MLQNIIRSCWSILPIILNLYYFVFNKVLSWDWISIICSVHWIRHRENQTFSKSFNIFYTKNVSQVKRADNCYNLYEKLGIQLGWLQSHYWPAWWLKSRFCKVIMGVQFSRDIIIMFDWFIVLQDLIPPTEGPLEVFVDIFIFEV